MDKDYSGMTVNERLFESGLLDKFDSALKSKNKEALRKILRTVALSEAEAEELVSNLLTKKGFGN